MERGHKPVIMKILKAGESGVISMNKISGIKIHFLLRIFLPPPSSLCTCPSSIRRHLPARRRHPVWLRGRSNGIPLLLSLLPPQQFTSFRSASLSKPGAVLRLRRSSPINATHRARSFVEWSPPITRSTITARGD